jgi:hypothetical protein
VCDCDVSLSICESVVTVPMEAATIRMQTSNQGPLQEELRANCIVNTKTVSAEPLTIEGPSAGGWDGYLQ